MSASPEAVSESATLNVPTQILEDILMSFKNEEQTVEQVRQKLANYQSSESQKVTDDQNVSKDSKPGVKSHMLSRAKSFPAKNETLDDAQRRRSHPEVFKFPDVNKLNPRELVIKESCAEHIPEGNESKISKSSLQSSVSVDGEVKGHSRSSSQGRQDPQGCEVQLSDPVDEGFSSCSTGVGGVSEIYFNNVINELVKTKQFLHNLQKQQNMFKEDKMKIDQLKEEMEQVKIQNQHLKGQLTRLNIVQGKMKCAQSSQREESVEIKTESCHMSTQTDLQPEACNAVQKTEDVVRIEFLSKDNVNLRQELMDLNEHYNKLKNSVKVLSTCLQEEKRRIRQYEEQINKQMSEKKQVVEKLGRLRQQHELVQQEKHQLEKTLALSSSPEPRYLSAYNHSPSGQSHSRHSSGGSHRSGGSPYASVVGISSASPAANFGSMTPDRQRPGHGMPTSIPLTLNNLSPNESGERAPSNLTGVPMTQRRYGLEQNDRANSAPSSYCAVGQFVSRNSGMTSNYEQMVRAGAYQERVSSEPSNHPVMTDTQAHPPLECPNCLREFQVENSYLIHLQKCIE